MKFFNWMQTKFNGGQGNNKPTTNQIKKEVPKEEFSDWPNGLLAIGTFGNSDLTQKQEKIKIEKNPQIQEQECSSDFSEFTAEEVEKLQKEMKKLLTRKPAAASKAEEQNVDLPLDRFLNCPSSLELDRTISNRFSINSYDKDDEEEIDRTIRIILGRCKDVCEKKKKKTIGKESISFLLKKMFVCSSGFVPSPSLRDTFQESRMEKLLRTMLTKQMNRQSSSRATVSKKYLEDNNKPKSKAENEENPEGSSKWVKTDSDCEFFLITIFQSSNEYN
ncbi:hypothetical protein RD792_015050 [Penstemon davidsonii]|uniref:Uncharacterized protein n=1 Tax=Penstemon davidsonii TaxID=160366 RepID=A0ABR0CRZ5_9LAMI|nr:hypothetical protein RD792_015050 [Penstemon davidsonii]